jgi:hypothetical protein
MALTNSSGRSQCSLAVETWLADTELLDPVTRACIQRAAENCPELERGADTFIELAGIGSRWGTPLEMPRFGSQRNTCGEMRSNEERQQIYRNTSASSVAESRHSWRSRGSQASGLSHQSQSSVGTRWSIDTRGSRRGRRQHKEHIRAAQRQKSSSIGQESWRVPVESHRPPSRHSPNEDAVPLYPQTLTCDEDSLYHFIPDDTKRFFCTWPSCNKRFDSRWAWERHEEALHYLPYRWTCRYQSTSPKTLPDCFVCKQQSADSNHIVEEHFHQCKQLSEIGRSFYRQDHFKAHIKRMHTLEPIPGPLLDAWKNHNPDFNHLHLNCGFCETTLPTWEDRQDHVYMHLNSGGLNKFNWANPEQANTFWETATISSDRQPWFEL